MGVTVRSTRFLWFPSSLAFWTGASVPLLARALPGSSLAEALVNAAFSALYPALVFAWALSNRQRATAAKGAVCALLGLAYGIGHSLVFSTSLDVLAHPLTAHFRVGHVVNLVYMLVVPWLIAVVYARRIAKNPTPAA